MTVPLDPEVKEQRAEERGYVTKPETYDSAILPKIEKSMATGLDLKATLADLDIDERLFYNWAGRKNADGELRHPEIAQSTTRGRSKQYAFLAKKGLHNLENRDFNSKTYELFMRNCFRWNSKDSEMTMAHPEFSGTVDQKSQSVDAEYRAGHMTQQKYKDMQQALNAEVERNDLAKVKEDIADWKKSQKPPEQK